MTMMMNVYNCFTRQTPQLLQSPHCLTRSSSKCEMNHGQLFDSFDGYVD